MSDAPKVISHEDWDAIPNAPLQGEVAGFYCVGAAVHQAIARTREAGQGRRTDRLPERRNRGPRSRRVEGDQLAAKKARAARVFAAAMKHAELADLMGRGFTKAQVSVLFTVLRCASENSGACDWFVSEIAFKSGFGPTITSAALKKLHNAAHLAITWRPQSGRKHLTNIARPGLSDVAETVSRRLTTRRVAVVQCGRKARQEPIRATTAKATSAPNHARSDAPGHAPWLDPEDFSSGSAERWGEPDAAWDLNQETLVPDGPITPLHAKLIEFIAVVAAKVRTATGESPLAATAS